MENRYFLNVTGHDVIAEYARELYEVIAEVSGAEFEKHIKKIREQVEKKGFILATKEEKYGATIYEVQKAGAFICAVGWVKKF